MRITEGGLSGLKLIELDVHRDDRGFFVERFQEAKFSDAKFLDHGLPAKFVQDNHSRSAPGVLRGLHFQGAAGESGAQGKLIGVTRGRIWDVVVDIRHESPTFGQHWSVELSGDGAGVGQLLWVPAGFAHGFCVLGEDDEEDADVIYKVDALYDPKLDAGILWNDPELGIRWPVSAPRISDKDQKLPTFRRCGEDRGWRKK